MPKEIYLDYNATTPVIQPVREAISEVLADNWGNPSSSHEVGKRAKIALEEARKEVADLIGALPKEVIFTSGGTESNNLAILGCARRHKEKGRHLITTRIEHPSVLNPFIRLMEEGFDVTFIKPGADGLVDPKEIEGAIRPETTFCSVMLANNETGAIQPVSEIARICKKNGVIFHTDAAQAVGKIPLDVKELGVDLLTIAGHKLYAPKGIGALYIREGIELENILFGAGQEMGKRPGTEPVPLAVGLGRACAVAKEDISEEKMRLMELRDLFLHGLKGIYPQLLTFCPSERCLPNTLAVSFKGLLGAKVLENAKGVMASTGAACHDRSVKVSHVLSSMGVPEADALGMVRFSMGRFTTKGAIEDAIGILKDAISNLKKGVNP